MTEALAIKAPWFNRLVDNARGAIEKAPAASVTGYGRTAVKTAVGYAAAGFTGSILGAAHGRFGLDTKLGPIDGWVAAAGGLAEIVLSAHKPQLAAFAGRVGEGAFTILAFRKGYNVVKGQPLPGSVTGGVQRVNVPSGGSGAKVAGEDPIEKAAKGLG